MARFSRIAVTQQMQETGIVPVFYHPDIAICQQIVLACYRGGARVFEYTNRGDYAHEPFGELLRWLETEAPDMILGVGSVVDPGTAALYMQLGANFIVSPVLSQDMAKVCNRRKVAWVPGCGSVSEISQAEEFGAEVVKIFPGAQVGGPSFVKSVKGPMPWTSIMPTGGVKPTYESLEPWFQAGVHCVGLGSQLISNELVEEQDYVGLEAKVQSAISMVQDIREEPVSL